MKQLAYFLITLLMLLFITFYFLKKDYNNFLRPIFGGVPHGAGDHALKIDNDLLLESIDFEVGTNHQKNDTLQLGQMPIMAKLSLSLSTDSLPWVLNETDSLFVKRIGCILDQTEATDYKLLTIQALNDKEMQSLVETPLAWQWKIKPKEEGKSLLLPILIIEIENKGKLDTIYKVPIKKYIHIKKEENPVIAQSRMTWNTITRHLHLVFIASFFSLFGWYGKDIRLRLQPPTVHWKAGNFDKHKKIAIICAYENSPDAEEFYRSFSIQRRRGYIDVWHQNLINAGQVVEEKTKTAVNNADAVMILLSADLFHNDYTYQLLNNVLIICEEQNKILIPVLVEYCNWEMSSFEPKQILAQNREPISSSAWDNRQHAVTTILKEINVVLNQKRA